MQNVIAKAQNQLCNTYSYSFITLLWVYIEIYVYTSKCINEMLSQTLYKIMIFHFQIFVIRGLLSCLLSFKQVCLNKDLMKKAGNGKLLWVDVEIYLCTDT